MAGVIAGLALAVTGALPAAAVETDTSELYVLHGVPGLTVDVWVNGTRTLENFAPGAMAGPLSLDPGTYTVAITAAGAADASAPAIGPVDLPLAANTSYTAVAHLAADGSPTATLFTNDTSATPAGKGRLTVRHVAAAPAVDVLAGGAPVMTALSNPDEKTLVLDPGTVSAAVAAAGTTTPVIGPADVTVTAGKDTIVYAWGSLADSNLMLATQVLDTTMSAPSGVPTGELGLADQSGGAALTWLVVAAALIGFAGLTAARQRTAAARH
jgi:hypothetical protein